MAREYFPKYCEVSRDVYDQVKAIMRGYDRLKRERLNVLHGTASGVDGLPRGSLPGDPTARRAEKLAYINERLAAIDQTAVEMLGWLGDKVDEAFDPIKAFWSYDYFNYQHIRKEGKDEGPVRKTWTRYRYRFAAGVAKRLNLF